MKKKIIAMITGLAIVAMIVPSSASAVTAAELQVQIDALMATLADLQTQLADLTGEPTGTVTGCTITSFARNLKVGMSGDDVKCLQIVLNSASDTELAAGVGSPGQETSYFGPKTKAAVIKFQEKYASAILASWGLTSGTGYVGSTTLAKLNVLLAAGEQEEEEEEEEEEEPVIPGGGLTISLAAGTPVVATIPYGAFNQSFTKFNVTAGTDGGDISISKITVTRTGLSANVDIDLVKIFDGTIQKGNSASLNSNNQAVFTLSTPIVVEAGTTKTLTIKCDIYSAAGTGRTIAMSVVSADDIISNASGTTGSATGNLMTISAVTIGSIDVYAGANNPTSDLTPDIGDTNVRILQMRLTAGSTEDVEVQQIIVTESGTATSTDLTNVELYNDTGIESLGEVSTFDAEGRATFDLATPLLITKGNSKNLSIRVDIISGSSRTVSAKVYDGGAFTITAVGKTYGYGVPLTNQTTDWNGYTSGNQIGQAFPQTIAAGALTVTKSSSTPATGNVAPGATAAPIVAFDLEAKGEPITITEFSNTVILGTPTYDQITGCSIYDEDDEVVAGPVDTTAVATADATHDDYLRWTDTWEVPLGINTYTVKCNLSTAITGNNVQIGFDLSNVEENTGGNAPDVSITCKGSDSNDSVTAAPATDVLGNTLTFQIADLDITTMTTPAATYIVPGQQNVHFANIQLNAVSSGEDINITSIGVTDTTVGAANNTNDIINLKLISTTVSQSNCTGSGRAWIDTGIAAVPQACRLADIEQPATGAGATTTKTTFTLSTPLVVSKESAEIIKVYGNYKNGIGTGSETHTFDIAVIGDIVGIGAITGTSLTSTHKALIAGDGQAMTYIEKGTLDSALDYGAPASTNIAVGDYGVTGIVMTKFKLTANYEDIDIDYFDLTRTSSGSIGAGADADIAAVYLYEGSELLATGALTTNSKYRFELTDYPISAYSSKVLTVKADFNGRLTGATSNHQNAFDLTTASTDSKATGLASGTVIRAASDITTQADTHIFRSIPTFEVIQPSSTVLASSNDQEIIRIRITADSAGDVKFVTGSTNFIRFTLSGSVATNTATSTSENFVLKNKTDSVTLQTVTADVSNRVTNNDGVSYLVTFNSLDYALEIGAGESKIIALEADLADFSDGGDTIQATIAATGSDLSWSDIDTAAITDANANFIWLPLKGPSLVKPAT